MNKYIYIFAGMFIFFTGLGSFVYFNQESTPITDRSFSSTKNLGAKKNKASAKDLRDLELGTVSASNEKIENEPSALFNDPAISQAWGLKKTDAARAWSLTRGSRDIIVAVIDTGIDVNHEDIKNNLWKNPGEIPGNGIDDDKNGFIDDVYGWNFVSNNNKLDDNHGHGTHIACIIGAEAGNKKGIIGIAPEVSIMTLKYYDPKVSGSDNLKNTVKAIQYAVKMGANIINYSGGGTDFSQEEHDAVAEAEKKGVLFVAAAGNERSNSDKFHYYPADYGLKNIISVTAIDPGTEVLPSSNYGVTTVDIAAPGQNIISCLPGNQYGTMTGTSQATAFVTGAAVIFMAHKNSKNYDTAKKYILATGDADSSLTSKTRTSRKLNLFKALTILDNDTTTSGLVSAPTKSFNSETSEKSNVSTMSQFGKSLMNAVQQGKETKPNRLGTKQTE